MLLKTQTLQITNIVGLHEFIYYNILDPFLMLRKYNVKSDTFIIIATTPATISDLSFIK